MFEQQRNLLLGALEQAHSAYNDSALFSGPIVHFHIKAVEAARVGDYGRFADHSYAMLTSWGMHRMGKSGLKLREFGAFCSSLDDVWPTAQALRWTKPGDLTDRDWDWLREVFCGIHCMASGASLVGNSNIMAHLLPDLIPPIHRQYTLRFLFGSGSIKNGADEEWIRLASMLREFFYPVLESTIFRAKASEWMADGSRREWDSSELKIIDNLIIGLAKVRSANNAGASR